MNDAMCCGSARESAGSDAVSTVRRLAEESERLAIRMRSMLGSVAMPEATCNTISKPLEDIPRTVPPLFGEIRDYCEVIRRNMRDMDTFLDRVDV